MKHIHNASRILLGFFFVFSGFVKGVDPIGVSYKIIEYLNAWQMEYLSPTATFLACLLCLAEFGLGICLITNIWSKIVAWKAFIFMCFFTITTLISALTNPVSDCGCFGDALKLTNWETFYKNIFLISLAIINLIGSFKINLTKPKNTIKAINISILALFTYLMWYSYNHLPIIDFRAYHKGANIIEKMAIPKNATQNIYQNVFIYQNKNTGKNETFTEENYPWEDTLNWKYIDMTSELIQKGYEPEIHDFFILDINGEDLKDAFLHNEDFVFMLTSRNINNTDWNKLTSRLNEIIDFCKENEYFFIGLTSSSVINAEKKLTENEISFFNFYTSDDTALKTMIRSNSGLILMNKGIIVDKWHINDIPSIENIYKICSNFYNN